MKKDLVTLVILAPLTFLSLFLYYYKNSRKFRQSIMAAAVAVSVYFSNLIPAHSVGEADAYVLQNQPHQSCSQRREGMFSHKSSSDGSNPGKSDGPGPGKPDSGGDGIPKFPKIESVEKTEERIETIETLTRRMKQISDSESDCKSAEQLQVDESYKSNSALKKVTGNANKNKRAVKNLEEVKEKLSQGEDPMKIGYKPTNLGNGFYYIRKPDARIVVKLDPTTGNSDIVAFGLRSNEKNMEKLATVVNSQCDTKIKINPKAY